MKIAVEWGRRGARAGGERGDVVVVVDVLSFSTAVATAIDVGLVIFPLAPGVDGAALARERGAELAVGRRFVPEHGRWSLSPATLAGAPVGTRIVLPSPNGSSCSAIAGEAAAVLAGALANATAVAGAARRRAEALGTGVTVVACGERWAAPREHEDELRPAIEDWLGAGAIVDRIGAGDLTPEAHAARASWRGLDDPIAAVAACPSALELIEIGYPQDVWFACRIDASPAAPELVDGAFTAARL